MPCPQVSGRLFWCAAATLLAAVTVNAQTTWHVDRDSPSDGPGHDWEHAYHYLQNALGVAGAGDTIRVAEGTHRPDETTADPTGTGLRTATFQLISGVTLAGGYAGYGTADPDERDIELYVTTLSGDIGTLENASDNSYHVATGDGTDATAVLDGFTITAGNSVGSGGGMHNQSGSPIVANCTFSGNSAEWSGGGMYNSDSSATIDDCTFLENTGTFVGGGGMANNGGSPTVTGCTFSGNVAGLPGQNQGAGGGMYNAGSSPTVIGCTFSGNIAAGFQPFTGLGGGMSNASGSAPSVIDCTFAGNQGYYGAGMHNWLSSHPRITGCTFIRNVATFQDTGSGMHNEASSPVVTNCTFIGNTGAGSPSGCSRVGGMLNRGGSNPVVTNCVFAGNPGCLVGGMLNEGSAPIVANCTFSGNEGLFFGAMDGNATVVNSIFWGNGGGAGQIASVTATYSDIQGGYAGVGNINADPLFVQIPDAGPDGEWGTADDDYGDLRLQPGSPCIDAADNTAVPSDTADLDGDSDTTERTPLDLDFHRRFVDDPDTANTGIADPPDYPDVVDMGAYEFQVPVFGDLDGDFDVDGDDFAIFADCMSGPDVSCQPDCDVADLDGDDDADVRDFMLFQQRFTGPLP